MPWMTSNRGQLGARVLGSGGLVPEFRGAGVPGGRGSGAQAALAWTTGHAARRLGRFDPHHHEPPRSSAGCAEDAIATKPMRPPDPPLLTPYRPFADPRASCDPVIMPTPRLLIIAVILSALGLGQAAYAQNAARVIAAPWADDSSHFQLKSSALFLENAESDAGFDTDLKISDTRFRWRKDTDTLYTPTVGFTYSHIDIHSGDPALPERLIDTSLATAIELYKNEQEDFHLGLLVGAGWAGDNAFQDTEQIYGIADLVAVWDLDPKRQLVLILDYNGNRNIFPDVPLPGVAYRQIVDDSLVFVLGLPASQVVWKPIEDLTLEVTYVLPVDFEIRAGYAITDSLELYGSFDSDKDAYDVEGLASNRRLFFRQRRVEAGIDFSPIDNTTITLAGGLAFDQEFTTGFDTRDDTTLTELDDEPYVRVGVNFMW